MLLYKIGLVITSMVAKIPRWFIHYGCMNQEILESSNNCSSSKS